MFTSRVLLILSLLCSLASAAPQAKLTYEWVDGVECFDLQAQCPEGSRSPPTWRARSIPRQIFPIDCW